MSAAQCQSGGPGETDSGTSRPGCVTGTACSALSECALSALAVSLYCNDCGVVVCSLLTGVCAVSIGSTAMTVKWWADHYGLTQLQLLECALLIIDCRVCAVVIISAVIGWLYCNDWGVLLLLSEVS